MNENGIEFKALDDTWRTARAVQGLTLYDVKRGGFAKPRSLANPNSLKLVKRQRGRIQANPQNYYGASQHGRVTGFMKHAQWRLDDELPFTTGLDHDFLADAIGHGLHVFTDRVQRGIFGLVVSPELETPTQETIINKFLQVAIRRLAVDSGPNGLLKIVLNDADPVTPLAIEQGFQSTGRFGEAAGAPGLQQQLFERVVTLHDLDH